MKTAEKQQSEQGRAALPKRSNFDTNGTLLLWALISVGLWLIAPERFTQTDGPGGVLTMVFVGLAGLFIAVFLWGFLKRFLK